ncbi:MAG TPA: hypothetical protein VG125_12670, partial [Pirellulales bacterium]|nr:hypothetical protein [Pirellulales bacterium]
MSASSTKSAFTINLAWSGVSGATGYRIYRGTASGLESVLVGTVFVSGTGVDSGNSTYTFDDDGSIATSANPPLFSTAYGDRLPGVTELSTSLTYGTAGLLDGQTFTISNGTVTRTFEFDDNNQLTNPTNIPVTFKPSDSSAQIAQDMIAAINGPGWNVYAATSDASNNNVNPGATNHSNPSDTQGDDSHQVNLFNSAWVQVGAAPADIESLPAPAQNAPVAMPGSGSLATGTYYYQVTAVTLGGETTAGNEESIAVNGPAGVTISWNPVAAATAYNIYRGTSAGGENVLVGTVAAGNTSFLDTGVGSPGTPPGATTAASAPHSTISSAYDTGLNSGSDPLLHPIVLSSAAGGSFAPNTAYYYLVTATDNNGKIYRSDEQSFTTSSGSEQLQLNWDPVASSGTWTYKVYRGTAIGTENVLLATTSGTSLLDNGGSLGPAAPGDASTVFNGYGVIGNAAGVGTSTQVDLMKIHLHAGDALNLQLNTSSILSPLKPAVRIFDANGNDISSNFQDSGQLPFGSLNSGALGLRQFNTSDPFTAGNNIYLSP